MASPDLRIEQPNFPRSLGMLPRPTLEGAEEVIRQVEDDIEAARRARAGKLIPGGDRKMLSTVIGPGQSHMLGTVVEQPNSIIARLV